MILDPYEDERRESEAETGDVLIPGPDALARERLPAVTRFDRSRLALAAAASFIVVAALSSAALSPNLAEPAPRHVIETRAPTLSLRPALAETPPSTGRAGPRDPGQKRRRR